jgi:CubicO group peptidase (beta-lactamase class C family)
MNPRLPRLFLLVGLIAAGVTLQSSKPTQLTPEGLDPTRLARIDRVLNEHVASDRLAGAVALALRDGKVVYEKAVGWADKESGTRMAPDSLFRIASQTKAVTSTAILILMEEGRLSITDPVSRYLPSFAKSVVSMPGAEADAVVPATRAITIRDLLTHTSGLSYGTDARLSARYAAAGLGPAAGNGWYTADKTEPICDTMDRLGTLPLAAQPGASWVYGYSTDVLGCVVERASGQPLDVFVRERITDPLKMSDTYFFLPETKRARLTTVYGSGAGGTIVRAPEGPRGQGHYVDGPRRSFAGGAGLVSTARDYARFLEMVRRGGELDGVRILSPRTVLLMTTNQVGTLHSSTGLGWSLAFETTDRFGANGLSAPGSFGWGGAYGSVYRVDPTERLTMVLMIQLMPNATDIRSMFPNLVHQAVVTSGDSGRNTGPSPLVRR